MVVMAQAGGPECRPWRVGRAQRTQHHRPGAPWLRANTDILPAETKTQGKAGHRSGQRPTSQRHSRAVQVPGIQSHAQDARSFQNDSQTQVTVSLKRGTKCHKTGFPI